MLRKDWDDLAKGEKGDWYFHSDQDYITIRYGEDVMDVVTIPIKVDSNGNPTAWLWNGDKEKPTLSPSILIRGNDGEPDKWHGFLTDGKVIDA